MKKLIIILMLASLSVVGMASANTVLRYTSISAGKTMLSRPQVFTAADSAITGKGFHIVTSDSLVIYINNPQQYLQYQTVTTTLLKNSGSPSVLITLSGRTLAADSWHTIGTPITWTTTGNNPATITGTTATNYNFLKVSFVASGATQCTRVATFDIRTANAFPYGATRVTGTAGATITGGIVNLNASSNNAVNIGTGTTTSTVTIGGAGAQTIAVGNGAAAKTVALGSSTTTSTTTLLSGSGGLLLNKDNNQPTNIGTGTSTGLVTIGGGSGTAAISSTNWGITSAGIVSGLSYTGAPTVIWAAGGSTVLATSGTDKACSNGARWWVELNIPDKVSLTGIAYLVGSVGGTDSVVVQLHNAAGVEVATSKKTGANHGAIVGTAAQFQSCPFYVGASATPYTAAAGKYFVSVQFNGTTAKFRSYPIPGSKFIAATAAGTWGTAANITPGTTFTADAGPIVMTY